MNLEQLQESFEKNFTEGEELGASLSVWKNGEELLSLHQGFCDKEESQPWTNETIAPVFSATKGPAAATTLLCLEEAGMNLETKVRRVWDKFPIAEATFGEMLSHQCGLSVIDEEVPIEDYERVIKAIESQSPHWEPFTEHGYHPRVIGFLEDECVRRFTGRPLGEIWRNEIAEPLGIDFWIGLPESEHGRVSPLYQGKMRAEQLQDGFYKEFATRGTLIQRAFSSPKGLNGVNNINKPEAWMGGYPALGGVGSAQGLAHFYQALLGTVSKSPFSSQILDWATNRLSNGFDKILFNQTAFSAGFMMDPLDEDGTRLRKLFGSSERGFGHPGAGGSHAFCDPETGVSFAYVMNQMEVSVLPGKKAQGLVAPLS